MGQDRDLEGSQVKRGAQEEPRRVPGIPGIGSGRGPSVPGKLKYGFLGPCLGFEQVLEKVPDYPGRIRRRFLGGPKYSQRRSPWKPVKSGRVRRKSWGDQGRDSKDLR